MQEGSVRIRCSRLLNKVLANQLDNSFILKVIEDAVQMLAKNVHDREKTLKSEYLQKILKVKVLLKIGFSKKQIIQLLNVVKSECKHLSYYWIQYGIINRELTRFEEANNAFREAAGARGYQSYQIRHAEAKNYMEWGIWELSHNTAQAPYYFEQGRSQMADLIHSAPSRYFSYSTHAYVDMVLRYYSKMNEDIDTDEINYIAAQISALLINNMDGFTVDIGNRFLNACSRVCPNDELDAIRKQLARSLENKGMIYDADLLEDDNT